jgi:uncharacterized protein
METDDRNVLGEKLQVCCSVTMTGFSRDGSCRTGPMDAGVHVVCAQVTAEFLEYTKAAGNDLSTPIKAYSFPGLKPGDRWCLCATRWREALAAGVAPPIDLSATHAKMLEYVPIDVLQQHAISTPD